MNNGSQPAQSIPVAKVMAALGQLHLRIIELETQNEALLAQVEGMRREQISMPVPSES